MWGVVLLGEGAGMHWTKFGKGKVGKIGAGVGGGWKDLSAI